MASDEDVFEDGHVGEEADVLEGAGDAGLGDEVGFAGEAGASVADGAFGGHVQAGEAVEEGGFAGAVGADEADDFAGADGEADAADGGESAEAHGDAVGSQDGVGVSGGCEAGCCGHGRHAFAWVAPRVASASGRRWSGTSSWPVSWNSSCFLRSGMSPSGRKRMRRTRAMPKRRSW